jgi:hypothetical protein
MHPQAQRQSGTGRGPAELLVKPLGRSRLRYLESDMGSSRPRERACHQRLLPTAVAAIVPQHARLAGSDQQHLILMAEGEGII